MLSPILGRPNEQEKALLEQATRAIEAYRADLRPLIQAGGPDCGRYTHFDLWCRGFASALVELEWSVRGTGKFGQQVTHTYEEAMGAEELSCYHTHLYFYKNAFIRLFSILDKLGYFLNELYRLRTEQVKTKFSYYTVLRRMHDNRLEAKLEERLFELKQQFRVPMDKLRKKRNMEIHHINAEMLDDLTRTDLCQADRTYIEDLADNLEDLRDGYEMVCRTLTIAFDYIKRDQAR